MHFIDDITLMHDTVTGSIVFIVPSPLLFESLDEFSFFVNGLSKQLSLYSDIKNEEPIITSDYASEVIESWNQLIQEKLETPGL